MVGPQLSWVSANDPYTKAREELVRDRIEAAGVKNTRVLRAMRDTPRHEFVPPAVRGQAYLDMALPIGESQTISSPFIVAWMTEAIDPQPTDRVLEIGTGSGYQAAVLSPLCDEVYTIEIVRPLGEQAKSVLTALGYENVSARVGDGFLGWPEAAPFDKIIVTCSPESIPQPLIDQLREGGKMIIPVGERYQQTLYLLTKVDGALVRQPLQATLFVPMTGAAEAERKRQPDGSQPEVVNGDFESPPPTGDPETIPAEESSEPSGPLVRRGPVPGEGGPDGAAGKQRLPDSVVGWYYGRQVTPMFGDAYEGKGFARFQNDTPNLSAHLLQGIPLDGRAVTTVRLSGAIRTQGVLSGSGSDTLPAIAVSLYDEQRRELGTFLIGPFRGTRSWRTQSRLIRVPPQTREAIVRIGLFGATGIADFDAVKLEAVR